MKKKAQAMSDAYKKFTTDFKSHAGAPGTADASALRSDATSLTDATSAVSEACGGK